jgi:hypothetical protein
MAVRLLFFAILLLLPEGVYAGKRDSAAQPANNPCFDYSAYVTLVGHANWIGAEGNAIAAVGNYAYIACDYRGIRIIDISDKARPSVVANLAAPEMALDVAVSGNYLLVAARKLWICDITTPAVPVVVSSLILPTQSYGVVVSGNLAFVADGYSGLKVVDITTPASPAIVGQLNTPDRCRDVVVSGGYAYLASGNAGVQVVDISDPAHPGAIGSVPTVLPARCVAAGNGYVYAGGGDPYSYGGGSFEVVDVHTPASPSVVSTRWMPDSTHRIRVEGNFVYLPFGTMDNPDNATATQPADLLETGPARANPAPAASFTQDVGLDILDVTNPLAPEVVAHVATPDDAFGIDVANGYAYVGYENGFEVVRLGNSLSPPSTGFIELPFGVGIAVNGNYAYLAQPNDGLAVVDISNPAAPLSGTVVDTHGDPNDVAVDGTLAFVADGNNGLTVLDVSSPASPVLLGNANTPYYAVSLAISGSHVLVADVNSGLQVVSVANPSLPAVVGSYNTPGLAYDVAIAGGGIAYVADVSTLQVLDISTPANPVFVGSVPVAAHGVAVSGNYAYVTGYELTVLDVSNPASPVEVGSVPYYGGARPVVEQGFAYVADGNALGIFDVTSPTSPILLGQAGEPYGGANAAAIAGDNMYGVGFGVWVSTVPCGIPTAVRDHKVPVMSAIRISPNPFNPTTTISYDMPESGRARLTIYAVSGERIAVLVDAFMARGTHEVRWNGRNGRGARVPSGVYFAELNVGTATHTKKLVLLK